MKPAAALAARRVVESKTCAHCGRTFEGIRIARYCSASCCEMASRARRKKKVIETRTGKTESGP